MLFYIILKMNHYYNTVKVLPNELNIHLNNTILDKLKDKIGDKCDKNGFIKKESINIISKSKPKIIPAHFDGSLYYRLEYNADVINPNINDLIDCVIIKKNKHGILAKEDCIYVVIPYIFNGINNEDTLNKLFINDKIQIKIIGKDYDINDTQINVHGDYIKKY